MQLRLGSLFRYGMGPQYLSPGRFLCHRSVRTPAADRTADRSGYYNDGVGCCDVMTDRTLARGPRPFVLVRMVYVPYPLFRAAAARSSVMSRAVDLQCERRYGIASRVREERKSVAHPHAAACSPVYSSVLLCTPAYSSVLQRTPMYSGVLWCTPVYSTSLQCTPVYSNVLQCTPVYSSVLQCTLVYSSSPQCILVYPSVL